MAKTRPVVPLAQVSCSFFVLNFFTDTTVYYKVPGCQEQPSTLVHEATTQRDGDNATSGAPGPCNSGEPLFFHFNYFLLILPSITKDLDVKNSPASRPTKPQHSGTTKPRPAVPPARALTVVHARMQATVRATNWAAAWGWPGWAVGQAA